MNFFELQIATIKEMINWRVSLDILLIATAIYALYQFLRATGTWKIALGILIAGGVFIFARLLNLKGIIWIYSFLSPIILISLIIIFQPEIRRLFERAATLMGKPSGKQNPNLAYIISDVVFDLAHKKRGAILILPGKDVLKPWISEGIVLDGLVTYPLLMSLFDPHSPGHDGALLIENERVSSYALRLPLSESGTLSEEYGTRHHAGLGLSEVTDALVIVVSEERSCVTLFQNGKLEVVQQKEILSSKITHHWLTAAKFLKPQTINTNLRFKEVVISFFLAFLFWSTVVLTQSEIKESIYTIDIDYVNLPKGMSVVEKSHSYVQIGVLGQESDLQRIVESSLRVRVDLANALAGKRNEVLTDKNVALPEGLRMTSIEPSHIEFVLQEKY